MRWSCASASCHLCHRQSQVPTTRCHIMSLSDIWERTINNAVYGDCRRHGSDQGPVTTHIHQNSTEHHTSINGCCYCDQPDQPHCSLNSTEHQHGRLLFTTVEINPLQFKGEAFPQQRSARSVCWLLFLILPLPKGGVLVSRSPPHSAVPAPGNKAWSLCWTCKAGALTI